MVVVNGVWIGLDEVGILDDVWGGVGRWLEEVVIMGVEGGNDIVG